MLCLKPQQLKLIIKNLQFQRATREQKNNEQSWTMCDNDKVIIRSKEQTSTADTRNKAIVALFACASEDLKLEVTV